MDPNLAVTTAQQGPMTTCHHLCGRQTEHRKNKLSQEVWSKLVSNPSPKPFANFPNGRLNPYPPPWHHGSAVPTQEDDDSDSLLQLLMVRNIWRGVAPARISKFLHLGFLWFLLISTGAEMLQDFFHQQHPLKSNARKLQNDVFPKLPDISPKNGKKHFQGPIFIFHRLHPCRVAPPKHSWPCSPRRSSWHRSRTPKTTLATPMAPPPNAKTCPNSVRQSVWSSPQATWKLKQVHSSGCSVVLCLLMLGLDDSQHEVWCNWGNSKTFHENEPLHESWGFIQHRSEVFENTSVIRTSQILILFMQGVLGTWVVLPWSLVPFQANILHGHAWTSKLLGKSLGKVTGVGRQPENINPMLNQWCSGDLHRSNEKWNL